MTGRPAGILRWLPALSLIAVLFWFSHQPSWPEAARGYPDWLLHGAAYAAVGAAFWYALGGDRGQPLGGARLTAAWALSLLAGVADEFHQSFVPGRDASSGDVLADATGAALAIAVVQFAASRTSWNNGES
jgi:VanZ family protein